METKINISDKDKNLFSKYNIINKTEGGFGCIYFLCEKENKERKVIAKTLKYELANNMEYYNRFLKEAQLSLSIEPNPLLAQPIALVTDFEIPYLLMHWVEGWGLNEWVKREVENKLPQPPEFIDWPEWWNLWVMHDEHPFNAASLLFYFLMICQALKHLYDHGINAHGDIHDNNIIIERGSNSFPVLIDFGLAQAPGLDTTEIIDIFQINLKKKILGCMPFMAPELIVGLKEPNQVTDIYSLGTTIYKLLMNKFPYNYFSILNSLKEGKNSINEISQQNILNPITNKISKRYKDIIYKCISFDQKNRFQNIQSLIYEIKETLWEDYKLNIEIKYKAYDEDQQNTLLELKINQASAMAENKNYNGAINLLIEILQINPKHFRALHNLAEIYYETGQYKLAKDIIDKLYLINDGDFHVLNTKGIIYNVLGKHEEAILYFNQAINNSKNHAQKRIALSNLSNAYRKINDLVKARTTIEESLKLGEDYRSLYEKALLEFKNENWEDTCNLCKKIIEMNPIELGAYDYWGSSLRQLGNSEEAYRIYKKGLSISPDDPDMLVGMAYAAAETGRSKAEILALLQKAEIAGRDDADVFALRAAASEGEEAIKYAKISLTKDPDDPIAKRILETQRHESIRNVFAEISIPNDKIGKYGISSDVFLSYTERLMDLSMSILNTEIPLSKKYLMQMLDGTDNNLLIIVCDIIQSNLNIADNTKIAAIYDVLSKIKQLLSN